MRSTFAPLALAALVAANPVPQGVTSAITPDTSAPQGCSPDYSGNFQIQVIKANSKRGLESRQDDSALVLTLSGGVLMDSKGRTGYVAANNQFQFDSPPQTGAIYTAGFSACSNGSLAIGADTTWYQCLSGTFYNLYDEASAAQCSPVHIQIIGGTAATTGVATQISDGQVTGSAVTAPITQISDGQVQATTATPVSQISDGQIQATTAAAAPVTQISDGQIQATTATPGCTEYVDGQPQCGSASPVTPTPTPGCSEYVDGQPQCSAASTGMMPSYGANTTVASPSAPIQPATGAAATAGLGNQIIGLAAGVLAVAML